MNGRALLLAPGLIWGASFLFIAEGLRAVEPNGITFFRIAVGFATLACFPSARTPVARQDYGKLAWLAVLWFAFPLSLFPYAERHVSSALTGMLNGASPLFSTIVACLATRQWPSRGIVAGLAVGMTGTAVMAMPALNEGRSTLGGVLLILVALVSYGVALSLARALQQTYGAVPVIWRAQGLALLMTAPLGLPEVWRAQWSAWPLICLVALGALGTGIAYIAMGRAAARFGAARASSTTFLIPPVSLALGVAVRGEHVPLLALAGGAVCLAGAWLMRRGSLEN